MEMGRTKGVGRVDDLQTLAGETFLRATITDPVAREKVDEGVYSGLEVTVNALGRIERISLVDRPLEKRGSQVNKAVLNKTLNDLQQAEQRLVAVAPKNVKEARERLEALHELRYMREQLTAKAAPIAVGSSRDNDDAALGVGAKPWRLRLSVAMR
jgi:hypothetical protein